MGRDSFAYPGASYSRRRKYAILRNVWLPSWETFRTISDFLRLNLGNWSRAIAPYLRMQRPENNHHFKFGAQHFTSVVRHLHFVGKNRTVCALAVRQGCILSMTWHPTFQRQFKAHEHPVARSARSQGALLDESGSSGPWRSLWHIRSRTAGTMPRSFIQFTCSKSRCEPGCARNLDHLIGQAVQSPEGSVAHPAFSSDPTAPCDSAIHGARGRALKCRMRRFLPFWDE